MLLAWDTKRWIDAEYSSAPAMGPEIYPFPRKWFLHLAPYANCFEILVCTLFGWFLAQLGSALLHHEHTEFVSRGLIV
jgi:hypothetical protein